MASFIQRIRKKFARFIKRKSISVFEVVYKRLPLYWKRFDKIPLFNWWEAQEGKTEYINKLGFKLPFLNKVYNEMVFQMENLDLEDIRLKAEYEILKAQYALTKDEMTNFEANILKAKIDESKKHDPKVNLNDFINVIELTLNCPGTINPNKTSASRAYSLYYRAKEKNKKILAENRKYGKHY